MRLTILITLIIGVLLELVQFQLAGIFFFPVIAYLILSLRQIEQYKVLDLVQLICASIAVGIIYNSNWGLLIIFAGILIFVHNILRHQIRRDFMNQLLLVILAVLLYQLFFNIQSNILLIAIRIVLTVCYLIFLDLLLNSRRIKETKATYKL